MANIMKIGGGGADQEDVESGISGMAQVSNGSLVVGKIYMFHSIHYTGSSDFGSNYRITSGATILKDDGMMHGPYTGKPFSYVALFKATSSSIGYSASGDTFGDTVKIFGPLNIE